MAFGQPLSIQILCFVPKSFYAVDVWPECCIEYDSDIVFYDVLLGLVGGVIACIVPENSPLLLLSDKTCCFFKDFTDIFRVEASILASHQEFPTLVRNHSAYDHMFIGGATLVSPLNWLCNRCP